VAELEDILAGLGECGWVRREFGWDRREFGWVRT